jgi:hypothetical protein
MGTDAAGVTAIPVPGHQQAGLPALHQQLVVRGSDGDGDLDGFRGMRSGRPQPIRSRWDLTGRTLAPAGQTLSRHGAVRVRTARCCCGAAEPGDLGGRARPRAGPAAQSGHVESEKVVAQGGALDSGGAQAERAAAEGVRTELEGGQLVEHPGVWDFGDVLEWDTDDETALT